MNQSERILVQTQSPAHTSISLSFYFFTFYIALCFILIMSDWDYSVTFKLGHRLETMPGVLGINSIKSAIGKVILGSVGGVLLLLPSPYKRQYRTIPLTFLFLYLLICFSSILWSSNPGLTLRRLLVLLVFLIGAFGAVRHLTTRQLLDIAIVISLIFITLGFAAELSHRTFNPFQSNYRFSGVMHPGAQGAICALLVVSSYCVLRKPDSNRGLYIAALLIGILFLLLTKSRTHTIGCFMAVYLTSFWKTSFRAKQLLILIPLVVACMFTLITSFTTAEFLRGVSGIFNFGRDLGTSELLNLNGRLPLWLYLKSYFLQKPVLGYGYHAFWTPGMVASFNNDSITWAGDSHSVIISLLLDLGLVGTLAYVLSVLSIFYLVVKDCSVSERPEVFFTFALTVFLINSGLVTSSPTSFVAFVAGIALLNSCIIKKNIND